MTLKLLLKTNRNPNIFRQEVKEDLNLEEFQKMERNGR